MCGLTSSLLTGFGFSAKSEANVWLGNYCFGPLLIFSLLHLCEMNEIVICIQTSYINVR